MKKINLFQSLLVSFCFLISVSIVFAQAPGDAKTPAQEQVIFATTTSVQDTGLLDVLKPMFEKQTSYKLKPIAVGTGQALALGAKGDADVLLVHAPAAEKEFMAGGNGVSRSLFAHNDFVLLGPKEDPAKVKGEKSITAAFDKMAKASSLFISRGDDSGTYKKEMAIWGKIKITPKGQTWYQEAGQGMGGTLSIAEEKNAYVLSDRSTFLARSGKTTLVVLSEGDPDLLNIYHVILVNPAKFPKINVEGGKAFAQFLLGKEVQDFLGTFGKDKLGQPLFNPDAGKPEESIGK